MSTVVVVVAGADALSPAARRRRPPSRSRRRRCRRRCCDRDGSPAPPPLPEPAAGAVDQEDVRPPVVVVVEDRDATAGGLEDVVLRALSTDHRAGAEARLWPPGRGSPRTRRCDRLLARVRHRALLIRRADTEIGERTDGFVPSMTHERQEDDSGKASRAVRSCVFSHLAPNFRPGGGQLNCEDRLAKDSRSS